MRAMLRPTSLLTREPTWRRPRPLLRSLPKADPDFGTVRHLSTFSSWDAATVSVPEVVDDDHLVVVGWGAAGVGGTWPFGYSQGAHTVIIGASHNGSGTGNSMALGILRRRPDAAWTSTLNLDTWGTSYRYSIGMLLRALYGFRGEVVRSEHQQGARATSFTMSVAANVGPPGGIAIAFADIDVGGAGPNASVSGAGWTLVAASGTSIMAVYVLPLDRALTPPAPVFSCSRSDYWSGILAYVR